MKREKDRAESRREKEKERNYELERIRLE